MTTQEHGYASVASGVDPIPNSPANGSPRWTTRRAHAADHVRRRDWARRQPTAPWKLGCSERGFQPHNRARARPRRTRAQHSQPAHGARGSRLSRREDDERAGPPNPSLVSDGPGLASEALTHPWQTRHIPRRPYLGQGSRSATSLRLAGHQALQRSELAIALRAGQQVLVGWIPERLIAGGEL